MFTSISIVSLLSYFLLGVIGWITYKIFIWPYYVSPLRKIPGPPSDNPILGNLQSLLSSVDSTDPKLEWVRKYGNIVKYNGLFNKPTLLVTDPKIIQDILTSSKAYDFVKSHNEFNLALLGNGLVFAEGDDHKRQRKMMTPTFTHGNIKEMVPTFIRVASTLKGLIEKEINQGNSNINLSPYISKTTLDIIGLVGFSYEFNSLTSSNELAAAYESLFNKQLSILQIAVMMAATYIPIIKDISTAMDVNFKNACEVISRVSRQLIMTFLMAGHETTSIAISWALYLLAQHPHEQDKLREELVKAFPDKSNFNPTYDEINSLEYLNCVIKENLRLIPPVPVVSRFNVKDEVFGEYMIPKTLIGTSVLQRSTELWGPTAENFDPKRWLDPSTTNAANLNYLPFLNGPRGCIGNKVALAEAKIILGMLIRNFVFQPTKGFKIKKASFPLTKPDPYLGLTVSIIES
ncbi:18796_t:CDS:2 [Rhizophagus irregularis]|nr:18796_t:CDS:2 [Rhizophagus irregularis]